MIGIAADHVKSAAFSLALEDNCFSNQFRNIACLKMRQPGNKTEVRATMEDAKIEDVNIAALEKLLNQSMMGIHHLFDNNQIAIVLKKPTEELDFFTAENMNVIQRLFDQLIQKTSIEEKRAFIERLDPAQYEILLRTYFHIVESTLLTHKPTRH